LTFPLEDCSEFVILILPLFILFFSWKKNSSEIDVLRSDRFFVIDVSLFTSTVTVKMDYEENMENARFATNEPTIEEGQAIQ
jgi:hypothetical protein